MTIRRLSLFASLGFLPVPALASAGGPGIGTPVGIFLMVIFLILGFIIGWMLKKP